MSDASSKHFLDTSVLRPMLLGSRIYREYFSDQFGQDNLYISRYVKMEFRRSFIKALIDFYFMLDMPQMRTIDDAFSLWSEKFRTSELKAILQIAGQLFATQSLSTSNPHHKKKALIELARLIKRYQIKLNGKFKDTATDTPRCARGGVTLNLKMTDLDSIKKSLREFVDKFNDVDNCRNNCRIDTFLLTRRKTTVERYVELGNKSPKNDDTKGFKKIAENFEEVLQNGSKSCTCKRCEKIGDAVIALDAPRDMTLEHTDSSFNHLCPPIAQPHRHHRSQTAIVNLATQKDK